MREHIKLFEEQNDEIHEFMKNHKIKKYDITPQGVDVNQVVDLYDCDLTRIPFQFNVIHGDFSCSNNELQSLQNAPRVVHGDFNCTNNKLKSLEFCPKFVKQNFYCNRNQISPWEYRYLLFSEIQGEIFIGKPKLNLFFRKYKNQKALIPQALKELREHQIQWDQKYA